MVTLGSLLFSNLLQACELRTSTDMPIATIDVWSDPIDERSCVVLVYEDCCELEIHAHGQQVLSSTYTSVADALRQAALWQPLADAHPEAA